MVQFRKTGLVVPSLKPEPSVIKLGAVFPTHQDESKKLFNFTKGPPPDSSAGVHTVQLDHAITEFFNGYFSTHDRSKKTEVAYKSDLEQLAAYAPKACSLSSFDAALIESWASDLRTKSYAPASMRRKIVVLKVFCSYWVRKGVLAESPFWRVQLSFGRIEQLPRALTEGEIRGLLAQAGRSRSAAEIPRKGAALAMNLGRRFSSRTYRALRN